MKRINPEVAFTTEFGWMALLFSALYLSEGWFDRWQRTGELHAKARAMVLHDRVVTGRILDRQA